VLNILEQATCYGRFMQKPIIIGVFLLGMLPFSASAQDAEKVAPKMPGQDDIVNGGRAERPGPIRPEPEIKEEEGDRKVLVDELQGLVFVSSMEEVAEEGTGHVEGVEAKTNDVLQTPAFKKIADQYLGEPVTLLSIKKLNRDVVRFYSNNDFPVVNVVVPEQDITNGVVQLVVLKGRVGKVVAEGNQHFDDKLLTSNVRTQKGETIRSSRILSDVRWLNRNPFRKVDLVYAPGEETGQTDVILKTQDRRPYRFYAGYEDSGNLQTGDNRWNAGFNWGNAFGLGHQFNYQYTFNQDTDLFEAHSASYIVPLPWHHELSVFGSHAETQVEPGTLGLGAAGTNLNLTGESTQISTRYTIPLPSFDSMKNYTHEFAAGYDFKTTNNNLEFGGIQVLDTDADISQFVASYSGSRPDSQGRTTFQAELVYSPGGMTSNNEDENFEALDPFADSEYTYTRIEAQRVQRLPYDFSLLGSATAQFSSDNLLGSEQLGGGGYRTVRGYEERAINGDEGVILNLELRSPSISVLKHAGISGYKDNLQFLMFVDYANLERKNKDPSTDDLATLASFGPGFRYSIPPYFNVRFDYGWQLNDPEVGALQDRGRGSRMHLGVTLSY